MISPRLRVRDVNPDHWARLFDLFLPPPGGDPVSGADGLGPLEQLARASAPQGPSSSALSTRQPVVVLFRRKQAVRMLSLGGPVRGSEVPEPGLADLHDVSAEGLRDFRKRHGLPLVVAVDLDRLPELWERAQQRVNPSDDLVVQYLSLLKSLKSSLGAGVLIEPPLLGSAPLPSARMLQTAFDRLLPDRRSAIFYVVDQGHLWTSLILAKRDGDLTLITTHDAIADQVAFGSIRADAPRVVEAVSRRIAPPHLAIFLPLRAWQRTVAGDRSAIARALAARRAVINPAPAWLLAVVGAGAVSDVASRSGRLAGKLLRSSRLRGLLPGGTGKAAEKLVQTLSNPLEALGLDPWEVLGWGRDWRRRTQLQRARFSQE